MIKKLTLLSMALSVCSTHAQTMFEIDKIADNENEKYVLVDKQRSIEYLSPKYYEYGSSTTNWHKASVEDMTDFFYDVFKGVSPRYQTKNHFKNLDLHDLARAVDEVKINKQYYETVLGFWRKDEPSQEWVFHCGWKEWAESKGHKKKNRGLGVHKGKPYNSGGKLGSVTQQQSGVSYDKNHRTQFNMHKDKYVRIKGREHRDDEYNCNCKGRFAFYDPKKALKRLNKKIDLDGEPNKVIAPGTPVDVPLPPIYLLLLFAMAPILIRKAK